MPADSNQLQLFGHLQTFGWIDEHTRLIRIDFDLYNPRNGLASSVTIAFEFTDGKFCTFLKNRHDFEMLGKC